MSRTPPFALPDTPIGYGCSGVWGERYFSERKAIRLVEQAVARGVRLFDSATFYCNGEAERRLGRALQAVGEPGVLVSGKVGTRLDNAGRHYKDFSETAIREDVSRSLSRLKRDALDILYLHGPDEHTLSPSLEILTRLKTEGLIRAIGVCGASGPLETAANQDALDALMCPYNVLNHAHVPAMRKAAARGAYVFAIAPIAQGLFRRTLFVPRTPADIWYLARALLYKRADLHRAQQVRKLLQSETDWQAAEVALAYALTPPFVNMALIATTRPAHLDQNVAAAGRKLPAPLIARLDAFATAT